MSCLLNALLRGQASPERSGHLPFDVDVSDLDYLLMCSSHVKRTLNARKGGSGQSMKQLKQQTNKYKNERKQ